MSELTGHVKQLEKLVDALKKADKVSASESDTLGLLASALSSLDGFDVSRARQAILERQTLVREALEQQISARRQELEQAARAAGLPFRRLSASDRVGSFSVDYSSRKVKLSVGSEELVTFDETSGSKVLERIVAEQDRLNALLIPRERFFKVLKTAFAMARADGKVSDGKAKIKELFPYIAVARQLTSDAFRKKPSAKSYLDYSLAMLAYELSKFGDSEQGWACGSERLSNQGPAMSTQQEAVVLPDATGNPVQVLWVWIA
jgi:hypothetical protein